MSASTTGSSFIPKPTNPLDVEEIRELIGHYLTSGDQVRCLRACRAWYASLLPFVWRDVDGVHWLGQIKNLYNILLLSHISRYVQSINTHHYTDERLDNMRFPNLREVRFQGSIRAGIARFFENHPTLTRVKISMMRDVNLKVLVGLPNLKMVEISLDRPFKSLYEDPDLQTLCTRLEVLITPFRDMPRVPDDLQCLHLKEIHVTNGFCWTEHQLEFLRWCPNLEVLKLVGSKWTSEYDNIIQEFIRLAGSGTWSKLHSLQWSARGVSDEQAAGILESMPWCDEWADRLSSFGPRSFQALGRHFRTLTILAIEECDNVTSEMIQEVMSSCPLLKVLSANRLEARHIAQGKTWICTSLTSLQVFIDFKEITVTTTMESECTTTTNIATEPTLEAAMTDEVKMKSLQRRVFEQLSLLRKLEILSFGRVKHIPSPSLDLRVFSGLEMLETLEQLRILDFRSTIQWMGTEDAQWMNEHWPQLREIHGTFNHESRAMRMAVEEAFRVNRAIQVIG
ncbi:hypothetical protein B0O80DRAFT_498303 [Mortierella sp. GBAus27b]|nr:hypothetical protein B0O80DRAFT_498303 [Mortierella sp. GBAus27b]